MTEQQKQPAPTPVSSTPAPAPAPAKAPASSAPTSPAKVPVKAPVASAPAQQAPATPAPVQSQPAPSETATVAEATTSKAQDVGKMFSGFLGGIAEKAKNIDMKELTEKAKQKVNEVKDRAAELAQGKTETFAQPREEIGLETMKELFHKMSGSMVEQMPPIVEAMLMDLCVGDQMLYKVNSGGITDISALALTMKSLLCFSKAGEQYICTIYPLCSIRGFQILPPRGDTAGALCVLTEIGEAKFPMLSVEHYCRALVLYRKLRELTGK